MRLLSKSLVARSLLLALGLVTLAAGCGRSVAFDDLAPAEIVVGPSDTVVLLRGYGPSWEQDRALDTAAAALREDGYFSVRDDSVFEVGLDVFDGRASRSDGGDFDAGTLSLAIDVADAVITERLRTETVTDEHGTAVVAEDRVLLAAVAYDVFLADDDGELLLDGERFAATHEVVLEADASPPTDAALLRVASRVALDEVLHLITPRSVRYRVELDDEDPALHPTLDRALDGDLAGAGADLEAFIAQHPLHAAARYNRGALLDAQRRYLDALEAYDAALHLKDGELYRQTREDCRQRLAHQQVLAGG